MSSIPLLTPRQADLIVASLRKVFQTGDIEHLTKAAYNFVMLSSGFIAHYNLHGFRSVYSNVNDLKNDLADNRKNNQWGNFRISDRDYFYYMQKANIYNRICGLFENETVKPSLFYQVP